MDLSPFIPVETAFFPTLAILVIGWLGFRWLRDQQREGYKHESFHDAVESVFLKAVQTDDYRDRVKRAVSEAVTLSFEPVTRALTEHSEKIDKLDDRITHAEVKIEGILGRTQLQRRSDLFVDPADGK